MTPSKQPFILGFNCVAPMTWEHIPDLAFPDKSTLSSTDSSSPDYILLFSWTGANGRHVTKYTSTYQSLFPSTPIIVITTTIKDLAFRSSAKKQARLQPALEHIRSTYGKLSNVLTHCFSEGGVHKAAEFAEAYHDCFGEKFPAVATCLDSTPGCPRYKNCVAAFKKSLPRNPVFRFTGLVIGGVVLGGTWILYCCFKGYENNVISKTRRRIEDEKFWDLGRPRCYIYSKADALIGWEHVREHAIGAMYKGVPVSEVCFEKSGHCNHISEDAERYWDAVTATWKGAMLDEKMRNV